MVTTAQRPKTAAPEVTREPTVKPRRRALYAVLAAALVVGIAAGAGGYLALSDDPSLSPAEVAEIRSSDMATTLEKQWLADPMNAARARFAEQASILEQQWLADPMNVARLRAEEYAEVSYQKWLASQN